METEMYTCADLTPVRIEENVDTPIDTTTWPLESIYTETALRGGPTNLAPCIMDGDLLYRETGVLMRYRDEYLDECEREINWVPVQHPRRLPADMDDTVGKGKTECPICRNRGYANRVCRGTTTGLLVQRSYRCPCRSSKIFWDFWDSERSPIPRHFRAANLDDMHPRGDLAIPTERQQKIIDFVRANRTASFWFCGPYSSGKTHLAYALLRDRARASAEQRAESLDLSSRRAVWAITVPGWLQHMTSYKSRSFDGDGNLLSSSATPAVQHWEIRNAAKHGLRPTLLLDELDKFAPTDAKLSDLQEIVNATYENDGQLIATTNGDLTKIKQKWKDEDMAGTIMSRFQRCGAGYRIEF